MNVLGAVGIPVAAMVFIAGVSYAAFRHVVATHQELVHHHALQLIYVEKLRSAFEWKVASSRGFFLTRDEVFLEREEAARAEFKSALDFLKKNFDDPDRTLLEEIDRAEEMHQNVVTELKEIRKSDDMARTTEVFEKQVWPRREQLRAAIAALERAEQVDFDRAIARSESATTNALRYSAAALIATFLLTVYFLIVGTRRLVTSHRTEARLRKEAEDALAGRSEFLSIVSHELRTPIYALKLQLELLSRRVERGATAEEQRDYVRRSERQLESLSHLMDGLFDLVRYERGQFELRYANVELTTLARDLTERFCGRGAEVACHVEAPQGALFVQADPRRVEQAVVNLLTNAIKYGEGKPVTVRVSCEEKFACITVSDQGPGIAPVDQERIFRRFERLRAGEAQPGLGLGLYIARRVAEAHGGSLTVKSELGSGAAFTLRLPRPPDEVQATTASSAGSHAGLQR